MVYGRARMVKASLVVLVLVMVWELITPLSNARLSKQIGALGKSPDIDRPIASHHTRDRHDLGCWDRVRKCEELAGLAGVWGYRRPNAISEWSTASSLPPSM